MSVLTVRRGAPGSRKPGLGPGWRSLTAIPRRWVAAAFAACALYAGAVALFTSNDIHRLWGTTAAAGYLLAAVATLVLAVAGAGPGAGAQPVRGAAVPLGWLAAPGSSSPRSA